MPSFVVITLFALSFVAPALVAVIVWARKPQTIEGLVVAMTIGPLTMIGIHIGFAIWLLPQYTLSTGAVFGLTMAWLAMASLTAGVVGGLADYTCKRIKSGEQARDAHVAKLTRVS